MRPISRFSLRDVPNVGTRSEVWLDGRPTGRAVQGCVLEAQFELDHCYLLMTTEGHPYEEALHLTLIGRDRELLEERTLAIPYRPGVLRNVDIVSDARVEFSFFGEERWRLTIHERPRRLLGLRRPLPGRTLRDLLAKHHIELRLVDS